MGDEGIRVLIVEETCSIFWVDKQVPCIQRSHLVAGMVRHIDISLALFMVNWMTISEGQCGVPQIDVILRTNMAIHPARGLRASTGKIAGG